MRRNLHEEGETIEQKVERIMSTEGAITETAPLIYTERKQGVVPDYNIRTDKMEYAVEAMGNGAKAQLAKRAELLKPKEKPAGENPAGENAPEVQP